MEHSLPPVAEPEKSFAPDAPDAKKSRWSLFELFRKKPEQAAEMAEGVNAEDKAEQGAERLEPIKRRRFGEAVMRLLRGESARPETKEPTMPVPAEHTAARTEAESTVEPTVIERAQEMGRGVIRLLRQVKGEVVAADRHDHTAIPTDTQPLEVADEQVRVAMRELVAPIETYAAEHGIPDQPVSRDVAAPAEQVSATLNMSGGDGVHVAETPRTTMFEAAVGAATAAAERVAEKFERTKERSHSRLGLFAVGAATVGVLVYNWRRNQALKKEQRTLKREQQRFERQVRRQQTDSHERLERLEQVRVAGLTQAERQEHVYAVSRYATSQAEVIHKVAEHRHVERPAMQPITRVEHQQQRESAPTLVTPVIEAPAVRREQVVAEAPRPSLTPSENPESAPRRVVERAMEALRPRQNQYAQNSTGGSPSGFAAGLGGFAGTLMSLTTGKAPDESTSATGDPALQPVVQARRTGQEWLLGVGLAIGMACVVLLLVNFL